MAPIPQHQLVRRSTSTDGHLAVIFAVVGSAIIVGGVLWGYLIPKWQAKHRKPVQTRHNGMGEISSNDKASKPTFELPIVFPPHPAVVIPIDKLRTSKEPICPDNMSSILVYDPRTQSPFPGNGSWRPTTLQIPTRKSSKDTNLLQQSTYLKPPLPSHRHTCSDAPCAVATDAKIDRAQHRCIKSGRSLLFVARAAGAPPPKRRLARPASDGSHYELSNGARSHLLPTSDQSYPNATYSQLPVRSNASKRVLSNPHLNEKDNASNPFLSNPHFDEKDVSSTRKAAISNGTSKKQLHTPAQGSSNVRNIFETPSSPATAPTTLFGSSPSHLHANSTPLTAPNSAAVLIHGTNGMHFGSSKFIASQPFTNDDSIFRERYSPCTKGGSEGHRTDCAMRMGHRPVSAPPSSSRHADEIDREVAGDLAIPGSGIQICPRPSSPSSGSSVDSLALLPRPLTFRGGMSSQSPLISPTPLGRSIHNASSPNISSRSKLTDLRPVTRGKAPTSKHPIRISTVFHPPSRFFSEISHDVNSHYHSLEKNPFLDRLGLARVGGNRRRSSIASLSTLKIPRSFRHGSSNSQAGSSIYSRDTKDMSLIQGPGLATGFMTSLRSLPERNLRRRPASFDETTFKDPPDWTPPLNRGTEAGSPHPSSASLHLKETAVHGVVHETIPHTPTCAKEGHPTTGTETETPAVLVGTASSTTFGTNMQIPKISIARSSDDVFGAAASSTGRQPHDVVGEEPGLDRGSHHCGRAVGSKLSQEDLVRYGGRTAPGGVGWI